MTWMKYRHNWSYSPGKWEWLDLVGTYSHEEAKDHAIELSNEVDDGGHHYRGIEYTLHEWPPLEVLIKERDEVAARAAASEAYRRHLDRLIDKARGGK